LHQFEEKTPKQNAIFKVQKDQASTKFAEETSFKNHLGLEQFFLSTTIATILVL